MILSQRRTHLRLWLAFAVLLPLGLVGALLARRDATPPAAPSPPGARVGQPERAP